MASKTNKDEDTEEDKVNASPNFENWMSSLPMTMHNQPLSKIAIPGSHNSGAFKADSSAGLAPDAPSYLQTVSQIPGIAQVALGIIQKWCLCQKMNFMQQLEAGIRYFDLRVSTKSDSEDLYLVHSLYGPKVSDFIEALVIFLKEHPHEVVLLDFNHFYAMELEHHLQLITLLQSQLESLICQRCQVEDLTLRNLWDKQKQVIIFYQHDEVTDFEETWTAANITAPYPNTPDHKACIEYLNHHLSLPPPREFRVCQGILTPSLQTLMMGQTSSLEKHNQTFLPHFCSWVAASPKNCAHPLNIVIADFVDSEDFVKKVVDLNYEQACL